MPDPRRSTCRSCPAQLMWARTAAGKLIPLDADPHPGGNVALVGDDRCEVLGPDARRLHGGPLYRSHFVTCPHAAAHRRRKAPPAYELGGEGGGA